MFPGPDMTADDKMTASLLALARALRQCAEALEQTALSLGKPAPSTAPPQTSDSSWPAFMSTRMASRYCGFKTSAGLRKAKSEGRVVPAGRRGGTGPWTWARAELDRFLSAAPREREPRGPAASAVPPAAGAKAIQVSEIDRARVRRKLEQAGYVVNRRRPR